ncbi:MFS transporter [Lihuaxuella thermophila]|uniref:MFS transporter, DHA2 family, metal-tetracycline-proton antiporter n=1 Tax=Lihuaxuella thermophila TaxID=1173111 RepID=A0A1H8EJ93_9BACL|nr:MFS transporter [Lihuaxuella thermophila]SEN19204.1 MFS transporter, DHA2 family, metal-tetracycline-proton antiporter [Lihuaxuella thermophila]
MNQESAPQERQEFDLRKFSWLIVYVIFFGVLNETVFNVSTPKIAEQFQLQPSEVSWVVTSFIITFGLGQVIFGKLADIYDLRRLIVIGILIYVSSSLLGMVLQAWYPFVILSRAIQGAGASALPALTMVIVARYFTPQQRGKLFGLFTSTASFAVGVGPVIGGFVSAYMHWSFLFLIPVFTLASLPAFLKLLPKEEPKEGTAKVDLLGAALLGAAISFLVIFCTNPEWPYLLISLVATVWFILHIRRTEQPFVDPELFRAPLYRTGVLIGFLLFGAVMGIVFVVPIMINTLHGLSTDEIGLVMFPGAFSAVIFGTVAGNLTAKKGSHPVFYTGIALVGASLLILAVLTDKWIWLTSAVLVLMYIGFSFVQTSMAETITQTLPASRIGVGMGFYGLAAFIAGAVGTAAVASLLDIGIFDFRFLPFVGRAEAHPFSNLLLVFAGITAVCGLMYLRTLGRKRQTEPVPAP